MIDATSSIDKDFPKTFPMIDNYVSALEKFGAFSNDLVYHAVIPAREADYARPTKPWPAAMVTMLNAMGMDKLFSHQAQATDLIRSRKHCVVATPTASGKTLIYTLPVLESLLADPQSKALFMFPLKALAQDQLKGFKRFASHLIGLPDPLAALYDGDTTSWIRTKIKKNPPAVLLTNPDMLHLGILPFHAQWASFFQHLDFVIVDEVHTYRGVMGSHMAWVFRRLIRICAAYGKTPTFVFSSATINNPGELAHELTGLDVEVITRSGAPTSKKHILFLDGQTAGAANTSITLLHAALARKLRTLVFTQSRKMAELISLWASHKAGPLADRISPYRAGYLPDERRKIENDLTSGKLLAVVSTSALELGIDIGKLDLCILVGYPGSIMATWQRAGRVGRAGRDSAVILVGHEDALDQYFMRHPKEFFSMPPEAAVINPDNPVIMTSHIECAAAEMPIQNDEPFARPDHVRRALVSLKNKGKLLLSEDGSTWFSARKYPQRAVSLRGSGHTFSIVARNSGEVIGEIDKMRAFHETHPGAVYLHQGVTYVVQKLDLATAIAVTSRRKVSYYTRPRTTKSTEILAIMDQKQVWSTRMFLGKLRITEQVNAYEKKANNGKFLGIVPLDLPPLIFETEGIWFEIPEWVRRRLETNNQHFMGGIHACEHAAIGILPLLVLTDRNDLGGISIPFHPQVGQAAVFIYDGIPGGAGLCRQAFGRGQELLERTLQVIESCPCTTGCPACVHSPKCGSGNRPIDKEASKTVLSLMRTGPLATEKMQVLSDYPQTRLSPKEAEPSMPHGTSPSSTSPGTATALHYGVLDIETRRSAQEVGGWNKAHKMGVSCVVVYDSRTDSYKDYLQDDVLQLVTDLQTMDLIVGFNIKRFDYLVLSGLSSFDFNALPTLDILEQVYNQLGYRLSLNHLAQATLGETKSANGLLALTWWKEGRLDDIITYCTQDVAVTHGLYKYGLEKGYLLFTNKAKKTVRVPVDW